MGRSCQAVLLILVFASVGRCQFPMDAGVSSEISCVTPEYLFPTWCHTDSIPDNLCSGIYVDNLNGFTLGTWCEPGIVPSLSLWYRRVEYQIDGGSWIEIKSSPTLELGNTNNYPFENKSFTLNDFGGLSYFGRSIRFRWQSYYPFEPDDIFEEGITCWVTIYESTGDTPTPLPTSVPVTTPIPGGYAFLYPDVGAPVFAYDYQGIEYNDIYSGGYESGTKFEGYDTSPYIQYPSLSDNTYHFGLKNKLIVPYLGSSGQFTRIKYRIDVGEAPDGVPTLTPFTRHEWITKLDTLYYGNNPEYLLFIRMPYADFLGKWMRVFVDVDYRVGGSFQVTNQEYVPGESEVVLFGDYGSTPTPSPTPVNTYTHTPTSTNTPTATNTPTVTVTPTPTNTPVVTPSPIISNGKAFFDGVNLWLMAASTSIPYATN